MTTDHVRVGDADRALVNDAPAGHRPSGFDPSREMANDLFGAQIVVPATHQSQLVPAANKFHVGNGDDGKHYWLTPTDVYERLNTEFHFTFDPCPFPKPDDFDGLTAPWGASSYVNPPFGSILHQGPGDKNPKKKGPTAWARKAIAEYRQGKRVVLVYPVDKWLLMLLEAGAQVRNLGDVKWLATEDGSQGKGTGRHIACFVLDPSDRDRSGEADETRNAAQPEARARAEGIAQGPQS